MRKEWWIVISSIVVLALLVVLYFMFFYSTSCKDNSCFSDNLVACKRATFNYENPETIMQYSILGKNLGKCDVNVKLLQIKTGTPDLAVLEGKEMICSNDIGVLIVPEKDLKNCHGLLKETIQEITIERMHTQLFNNIEGIKAAENVLNSTKL